MLPFVFSTWFVEVTEGGADVGTADTLGKDAWRVSFLQ